MRTIKTLEERKQEILDGAMKLFGEKGYDKTSISDIAAFLGISQGLCYRYFKSKEDIFESAVDFYAQSMADEMILIINDPKLELMKKISYIPQLNEMEKKKKSYYNFFHREGAEAIHDKLSITICRKVCPFVEELLQKESEKGVIYLKDVKTTASFCVYGQLGILLDKKMDSDEKNIRIKDFFNIMLKSINQ
jgi:AcrR family transcriptional regulator